MSKPMAKTVPGMAYERRKFQTLCGEFIWIKRARKCCSRAVSTQNTIANPETSRLFCFCIARNIHSTFDQNTVLTNKLIEIGE
ncbi:hypothetical protein INT80_01970 [Gallibacterium anatis]|uniref:Uncharacterized protein n=1 Tax=Gallibacterium anatis TaxID=750 RepID=A0A930Y4S9_9PAST|nr:hypothetical protein [Gallibacterium anatis]